MPIVQTVFDFQCQGYGWSESWFKDTQLASLKAFYTASALPLLEKRQAMLAYEASLTACSNSYTDVRSDSYLIYTGFYLGGLGPDVHAASPHETIYTVGRADNDKKRKGIFFRGIPDDVVLNGGIFNNGYATWVGPATAFMDAIAQNGWGWMSSVPGPMQFAITEYVQTVDQFVQFSFAGTPFQGVQIGTYKRVRMLFKGIKSVLNGAQTVEVMGPSSARSLKPTAVFPFTKTGLLTVYTPTFYPIVNYSFQKTGQRRAGRPKLHTPGHQSARPKG